jgi:hypothetical protein
MQPTEEGRMPVYLVGYDLRHGTEAEYTELIEAIKKISASWWHCLDSTWLIVHPGPASSIRDALGPHLQWPDDQRRGDKLFVARVDKGAAWTKSFNDNCQGWLREHL